MATQLVPDWQRATWGKGREEGETGVELLPETQRQWKEGDSERMEESGEPWEVGKAWNSGDPGASGCELGRRGDMGRGQMEVVKGGWGDLMKLRGMGRQRDWQIWGEEEMVRT